MRLQQQAETGTGATPRPGGVATANAEVDPDKTFGTEKV